jgi:hypothetical protein
MVLPSLTLTSILDNNSKEDGYVFETALLILSTPKV